MWGSGSFSPFEEAQSREGAQVPRDKRHRGGRDFSGFHSIRCGSGDPGKLIAMSSLVGRIPFPFESIYSASKFGVTGMVLSLKYEVAPFGIQVALIEPAQVSTTFAAKIHVLPPGKFGLPGSGPAVYRTR
ncbi:MAG: SDR family NAD(P)-dependent oxidoreductase [Desulfosudis oleivorans]|nr:SDR family NAD(P)-dependent oxidoreductase [Desulfosudis oleivorans]